MVLQNKSTDEKTNNDDYNKIFEDVLEYVSNSFSTI